MLDPGLEPSEETNKTLVQIAPAYRAALLRQGSTLKLKVRSASGQPAIASNGRRERHQASLGHGELWAPWFLLQSSFTTHLGNS